MRGPASLVSADGELQRAPTQNENLHIPAPSDLGVTWLEAWKHYIGGLFTMDLVDQAGPSQAMQVMQRGTWATNAYVDMGL